MYMQDGLHDKKKIKFSNKKKIFLLIIMTNICNNLI